MTAPTEIRTRKTPLMQSMIDAVVAAIGERDEAELIATIGYCRTPEAAVKRCMAAFNIQPSPAGDGTTVELVTGQAAEDRIAERVTEAEAAVLQVAVDVMAGDQPVEALTTALFPNGVAAEFAQMEAEGRIVDETAAQLAEAEAMEDARDAADQAHVEELAAPKAKRTRKPRDPNAVAPRRTRASRKPARNAAEEQAAQQ